MKYVYSMNMCSACVKLKKDLDDQCAEYIERDGERLTPPVDKETWDDIDEAAFIQLQMQNLTFPVLIEVEDELGGNPYETGKEGEI